MSAFTWTAHRLCCSATILITLILCTWSIEGSQAQPSLDVASDRELFAGFCLGVAQAAARDLTLVGPQNPDPTITEYTNRQVSRFREYLLARGLLLGARSSNAMMGVLIATGRGKENYERCSAKTAYCVKSCGWGPDYTICFKRCSQDELACPAVGRCGEAEGLPF